MRGFRELSSSIFVLTIVLLCGCSRVEHSADGMTVLTHRGSRVRVEVVDNNTLHISTTVVTNPFSNRKSLLATNTQRRDTFSVVTTKESAILRTTELCAEVEFSSGSVTISDKSGKLLLTEGANALYPLGTQADGCYQIWQEFKVDNSNNFFGKDSVANNRLLAISRDGFALFWDNTSPTQLKLNHPRNTIEWRSDVADHIDYYVIAGNSHKQLLSGYHTLTGSRAMLPKWAFGLWYNQRCYNSSDELIATASEFRERGIAFDNLLLDLKGDAADSLCATEFDTLRFSSPKRLIDSLHRLGVHLSVATNKEMTERPSMDSWQSDIVATSREQDSLLVNSLLADSNYLYTEARYQNIREMLAAHHSISQSLESSSNPRVLLFTKSEFATQHRYPVVQLLGDVEADWQGMKSQLKEGLELSIAGVHYWMTNIGGANLAERFVKIRKASRQEEEWREMNTRWYQWGVFTPLYGSLGSYPMREIYNIAPYKHSAYRSIVYYNKLRYRLTPYIYSLTATTNGESRAVTSPLELAFSDDKQAEGREQFLFGDAIMVCPVMEYGARVVKTYLPEGRWYDFYTEKVVEGGKEIEVAAPYEQLPLFARGGKIIPLSPIIDYTVQPTKGTLIVNLYTGSDAHFTLYEDDGTTVAHESGNYSTIAMKWDEQARSFSLGERSGKFDGMNSKREIILRIISDKGVQTRFISYNGSAERVTIE